MNSVLRKLLLFFLPCGLLALGPARAREAEEDWPGWRGPLRQGVSSETGVAMQWSETENVAWKTAIPGAGWSSPVVSGDRVFLTTATDGGAVCHVICLNRKTGRILWDAEIYRQTPGKKEGRNSYATPTPVTDGRLVYAVFYDGGIAALDLNGKIVWLNREHRYYSVHGSGASPILHEDLLIFPYDITSDGPDKAVGHTKPWDGSFILALDKRTGKLRWKASRGLSRVAHVTPQIANWGGRSILISGAGDVVQGFDLRDGKRLWSAPSIGEGVVPSVVVGDGMIFTTSGFGDPAICAFRASESATPRLAWQVKKAVPMIPSFVYADGLLFTISENGIALCIKATTGEIVWQERIGGQHYASPVSSGGRIYFLSETCESVVIEASPQFKVVARNRVQGNCQASYAVSRRQLFIRTQDQLYCIGRQ